MFQSVGLGGAAEKAYRKILRSGGVSREELRAELDCDAATVDGVVRLLIDSSLIRHSWEDSELLRPISPEVSLNALLARQQADILRRQQEVEEGRSLAAQLIAEYADLRAGREAQVERLQGIDEIRSRVEALVQDVDAEILAFATGRISDGNGVARVQDQAVLDRGVAMRTMYLDSVRNHQESLDYARWLTGAGAQVRTLPTLPLRMVIYDRRHAIVPVDPASPRDGALLMSGKGVLAALVALFEQSWAAGVPMGEAVEKDAEGLAPNERELLRLLAEGLTDEAASRKLGVSLRTVRRMASALMDRLEARSRFQAGLRAHERGWI